MRSTTFTQALQKLKYIFSGKFPIALLHTIGNKIYF